MIVSLITPQPMGQGLPSAASHSMRPNTHVGNAHVAAGSAQESNAPTGHDMLQTNRPRTQAEGNGDTRNIGNGNGNGNCNGNGSRIASLPPGDSLARVLSEGLALKQMAERARERTTVSTTAAPVYARFKPNLRSAFVATLLLSDRVTTHVDTRRSSTPPTSGKQPSNTGETAGPDAEDMRLASRPASTDESGTRATDATACDQIVTSPDCRAARLPRMSEKHGGPEQRPASATSAPPMAYGARTNNMLVDAAMASISEAYFTEFPCKDDGRKAIESIFDYVAYNKWKGENHEPKDSDGAWVQMNIEILDHADWELYRIGRKPSDDSRINLLTTLRIFSYSKLRQALSEAGTNRKIENLFSTKKLLCFDFILEKLVYLLSGGDPDQILKNINVHIDRIGKSAAHLKLSLSEDLDFRISQNEISRTVRLLLDPKYLSAGLDNPERLRAWIADKGTAWILQLENMTIQFWSGISNLALQRQLSEFNAQVERYAHAQGMGHPASEKSGAVNAKPFDYSSTALDASKNTDASVDSMGALHNARLQLLGQLTLNQTSTLYHPILSLPAYIDDKIRAGISHFAKTSKKYQKFTPSTSVKLELVPEERSAHGLLLMRPREKIARYYSIKQIITQNYLHDIQRLRDPHGRTYRVMKRHGEDLLAHLESIDIRRMALQDINRYRNNPQTINGFRSMLASLVMMRCLQYLDTANDLPTVYAIESFLRGEIQAETLSFHGAPVSGVFMIRTGPQSAILFCAFDNYLFLAGSEHNDARQRPDDAENEAITRFDPSQEFKDWILSKLPLHAAIKYGGDPNAFDPPALNPFSKIVGPRAHLHPIRTYPSASNEALITTLHAIEMDRYVSDIQTLFGRKTTLIDRLKEAGINVFNLMSIPLSIIKPTPSLGSLAASVFNFAMTTDLKHLGLGVSAITSLMSERPDRAEAYYNDALISGILGLVIGGGDGVLSQLSAISHRISIRNVEDAGILSRRPMNVANVGQALTLFRQIRNEIPYLSQNIGLRLRLFKANPAQTRHVAQASGPAQGQSALNRDTVVGEKSTVASDGATGPSRSFAKKFLRAVHGNFAVLSSRKINVAGKFRVTDELMRNHIDGTIWSTFRIDMDTYYIYTLRPKDTLIHLANKRLTVSAHGSYIEQEGIALERLVPVPSGKVVSYFTPAGMALGDPGLSETMTFNEIFPYVMATSHSATVSDEAIKRFNTPFDMLGHDMQENTIRFREQYFSNFPYENEAEINRALVKNLIHNKGTEKVSDLAVVKPGKALTLSDLLKKETGHNDVLISACRVFAVNGTATINALQPDLKEKLFSALSRNYEAAASRPVKDVQRVVGSPQLGRKTFDTILTVHDEIADNLRCEPRKPCLKVGERRYTAYELLRTYVVNQNKPSSP